MQTRRVSLFEAACNTASGFVVSWLLGMLIFPLFGWDVSPSQNTAVVAIYTLVSIVRSYIWRRIFNRRR